jgi:hypothetical protein
VAAVRVLVARAHYNQRLKIFACKLNASFYLRIKGGILILYILFKILGYNMVLREIMC